MLEDKTKQVSQKNQTSVQPRPKIHSTWHRSATLTFYFSFFLFCAIHLVKSEVGLEVGNPKLPDATHHGLWHEETWQSAGPLCILACGWKAKIRILHNVSPTTANPSIFRSMAMATSPNGLIGSEPSLAKSPASPLGWSKPALEVSMIRTTPMRELHSSSPIPPNDDKNTSAPNPWIWKLDKILPVPMYHPLERTALTINDLTFDVIASRFSDFMRTRSIACSYFDDKGRVDCMTESLIKFSVQLWRGASADTTIVEVSRRQGCCMEMQMLRNHLFKSIQSGENVPAPSEHSRKTSSFIERVVESATKPRRPLSIRRQQQLPMDGTYFSNALEICKQLLASDHLDQNRLGLESLVCLTDHTKVLSENSITASYEVLADPAFQGLLTKFFIDTRSWTGETYFVVPNNNKRKHYEGVNVLITCFYALEER